MSDSRGCLGAPSPWLLLACLLTCPTGAPLAAQPTAALQLGSGVALQITAEQNTPRDGLTAQVHNMLQRVSRFNQHQGASFTGWDEGGGIFVQRRRGDQVTIEHVEPGGQTQPVVVLAQPAQIGPWAPPSADPAFLFVNDYQGDERYQIYLFDLQRGESRPLTSGQSRNALPIWSADGESIAFSSNRRNGVSSDVYLLPIEPDQDPVMVASRGALIPHDWSADGALLAVQDYHSVNSSRLYIFDLSRNSLYEVNDEQREVMAYGKARFIPSSRGMFILTDEGGEFMTLQQYKIIRRARFHPTRITRYRSLSGDIPWDVTDFELSHDGRWIAWIVNEDGWDQLYLRDLRGEQAQRVQQLPRGLVHGLRFAHDDQQLGMTVTTDSQPEQAWSIDLESLDARAWSQPDQTVPGSEAELIRYPVTARHGVEEIPAFVYRPPNANPDAPAPVVLWLHGGPESQFRPAYHPRIQFWTQQLGVAVVAPNFRGSTGYGRTFTRLDNGAERARAVDDVGAALDWIASQPDLDASRVCVYGSSYGGFLALAAMTRWPERMRCGMELAGITDFNLFLQNTSPGRQQLRRFEYGDERDAASAAVLRELSPMTHIDKLSAPLLVAHGRNDARVPFAQSERLVEHLRGRQHPVWTAFANNEGHTWLRQDNRDALDAVMSAFLQRYLLGDPSPAADSQMVHNDPYQTDGETSP